MTVIVITKSKKTYELFAPLEKSKSFDLMKALPEEYRSILKSEKSQTENSILVYIDSDSFTPEEIKKETRFCLRQKSVPVGIIDFKGKIDDPAALFHAGISDYLGRKLKEAPVTAKRVKNVIEYAGNEIQSDGAVQAPCESEFDKKLLVPESNWKNVKKGKPYIFCFMFVELDLPNEWKKKSGHTHLNKVKESFLHYIRNAVTPINGKVWMWNEYGGVVLFPYRSGPCPVMLTACKLMVNRAIASCEDLNFKTDISYRLCVHIGETVYQEKGRTGEIISDTVNFIFHLGQKFARPGNMYITKPVFDKAEEGLKNLFLDEGEFEERKVFRMRTVR